MELGKLNRYRSWLISGALALLVVLWLGSGQVGGDDTVVAATAVDGTEPAAAAKASVRVRTQQAEEVTRTIVVNGMTEPARVVTIAAETDGRIETVGARRGASVDRGAVIVRLDERDRSVRLAEARATVRQREVEYEARERLKSESYVSEAQLKEAIAMLETARAELTRAELDLEYMVVRAPFDGALQARHVEIGDFVSVRRLSTTAGSSYRPTFRNSTRLTCSPASPPRPRSQPASRCRARYVTWRRLPTRQPVPLPSNSKWTTRPAACVPAARRN